MRPVREITAAEENFRIERRDGFEVIRRDPVEPEPAGTIVLMPFRVARYREDCDGSLMAGLEAIDRDGEPTGWEPRNIGLGPETALVVTAEELRALFGGPEPSPPRTGDFAP